MSEWLRGWYRNWWTAHRIRVLLQYGWCPLCNSSPPAVNCAVCGGTRHYGPAADLPSRSLYAGRYVRVRGQ